MVGQRLDSVTSEVSSDPGGSGLLFRVLLGRCVVVPPGCGGQRGAEPRSSRGAAAVSVRARSSGAKQAPKAEFDL